VAAAGERTFLARSETDHFRYNIVWRLANAGCPPPKVVARRKSLRQKNFEMRQLAHLPRRARQRHRASVIGNRRRASSHPSFASALWVFSHVGSTHFFPIIGAMAIDLSRRWNAEGWFSRGIRRLRRVTAADYCKPAAKMSDL
jgi:hypothetical protein